MKILNEKMIGSSEESRELYMMRSADNASPNQSSAAPEVNIDSGPREEGEVDFRTNDVVEYGSPMG